MPSFPRNTGADPGRGVSVLTNERREFWPSANQKTVFRARPWPWSGLPTHIVVVFVNKRQTCSNANERTQICGSQHVVHCVKIANLKNGKPCPHTPHPASSLALTISKESVAESVYNGQGSHQRGGTEGLLMEGGGRGDPALTSSWSKKGLGRNARD